jgi:PAS domain S-box-containing protein
MASPTTFELGVPGADGASASTVASHALLEAISDAVVAVDGAGVVTYWGRGAESLYETASGDAIGRPLAELYVFEWVSPEDERRAWSALEQEGRWRGRNVHVLRSGARRHVESTVSVLRDGDGRRAGLLAVIRDETAKVEAEAARRRAEEDLRISEARYQELFRSLLETIFVYEPVRDERGALVDAILRDANDAALAQVGRTLPEVAGRRASELFGADAMQPFLARLAEVLETGAPARWESTFDWNARQYVASAHRIAGDLLVAAGLDITERRRAEEALRDTDRRKTEFLAFLSHELRNPLGPIRNSVVLLDKAPPDGAVARRAREVLQRQTKQLERLVDDLLDISRIAHGKLEVRLARADLRELVRRAYADARALFDQRDVELLLAEPPEPLWVEADAARFAQMLGNLLNNALKFTPPRGRVEVRAARQGASCEVSVRDNGIGLEAAELERIFDPFVQAERNRGGHGGLGIGLALVRELAAKHGGSVRAASGGLGAGAEFTLRLPLAQGTPEDASALRARSAVERLAILVIEDDEDAAATLADLLGLTGHRVRVERTGAAGIAAAAGERFDVLLCDVGLPDVSGHEVIRSIRASPGGADVVAVALTGYAQPHDRAAALAAGFDAHLPKPPPLDLLEGLLADAARARSSRRGPTP